MQKKQMEAHSFPTNLTNAKKIVPICAYLYLRISIVALLFVSSNVFDNFDRLARLYHCHWSVLWYKLYYWQWAKRQWIELFLELWIHKSVVGLGHCSRNDKTYDATQSLHSEVIVWG